MEVTSLKCLICNDNLPPLSSPIKELDFENENVNLVSENKCDTFSSSTSSSSSSLINQHVHTIFI